MSDNNSLSIEEIVSRLVIGGLDKLIRQSAANRLSNVLTNNKFGRVKVYTPPAGGFTTVSYHEVETDFFGVRIGIPNLHTAEITGVKVQISLCNGYSETGQPHYVTPPVPNGGGWTNMQYLGGTTMTLAPRIANNIQSITYTDIKAIRNLDRVDGKTRPMLCVKVQYPDGAVISVPSQDFYGWRTMDDSGRQMRVSSQSVLGIDNQLLYTTNSSIDTNSVIPTLKYYVTNRGKQIMMVGDSITEGVGGNTRAWGGLQRASMEISNTTDPVEYFNGGMNSLGSSSYRQMVTNFLEAVSPTHLFYQPLSVNDIDAAGMNDFSYEQLYSGLSEVLEFIRTAVSKPQFITLGCLPYNAAFKDAGANDYKRRDANTWLSTLVGLSYVNGYVETFSGPEDDDGQTTIIPGASNDNVHPNDFGADLLKAVVSPFIEELI